jgi:ABC-type bacteriocin/lantibiotic exporter with double-glycine peptidase domain
MNNNPDYIIAEDLSFSYSEGGRRVIDSLSLKIGKGEYVAVIGRNGSGKSTFARMLNGLNEPSGGRLTVAGIDISAGMSDDSLIELLDFLIVIYVAQ